MSEIYNGGTFYIIQYNGKDKLQNVGKRWVSGGGLKMAEGREVVKKKKKIIRDSLTRFWRAANDFNEYRWVPDDPLKVFFFFLLFHIGF